MSKERNIIETNLARISCSVEGAEPGAEREHARMQWLLR